MPTVTRSRVEDILESIWTRLQDVTELPPERVLDVQREDPPFDAHGDSYVYTRIEDGDWDDAVFVGAGRIDARERLPFAVVVRTRLALDESNNDRLWIKDHAEMRRRVQDALLCWYPRDGENNLLTTEPIHPDNSRQPRKDLGTKTKPNKEWGQSVLRFVMIYEVDVNQSYQ